MARSNEVKPSRPWTDAAPGRGWQIAWGILLIITGILAVMMPGVAALATVLVFAWLLVFGGAFEIAYAIQTRHRDGFGWKLVSGILTLLLGIAMLLVPIVGVASLALLVGGFLLATGIARAILAVRLKPRRGWGWILFDGLLSIALAILIWIGWPASSLAVIGLLTGFSLISTGIWRIMLAP
ncbi:MAG: HdeD family acid-resistance protein [Gammaproteobacteria bacterium]